MRVLIINKFLYPNGGSETYIFKLGEALEQHGHEVQYFGMEHEGRCVGNRVNAYTSGMDFHGGSKLSKLTYPIKTIYSKEINTYEQLREIDSDSNQLKTDAIQVICEALDARPEAVTDITVLKKGMTNRSFLFTCKGKKYIMRIPGEGTDQLINRRQELIALDASYKKYVEEK